MDKEDDDILSQIMDKDSSVEKRLSRVYMKNLNGKNSLSSLKR